MWKLIIVYENSIALEMGARVALYKLKIMATKELSLTSAVENTVPKWLN